MDVEADIKTDIKTEIKIEVKKDFIPAGRLNRPAYYNPGQFITVHETGNFSKGADAAAHARYLKTVNDKISWHYTVDDKDCYQHLPEEETAFHAGDGAGDGNRKSIGIEICVNEGGELEKAVNNAARLVAKIMVRRKIPLENIVPHHHWSGKNCPQGILAGKPVNWQDFLFLVEAQRERQPHWAEGFLLYLQEKGVVDTPVAWSDLDAPLGKGQALALCGKLLKRVL